MHVFYTIKCDFYLFTNWTFLCIIKVYIKLIGENNMISAKEARKLFATEEELKELKEKRINEVVDKVLSLFERDIKNTAKLYKSVSIPVLLGDMRNYEDTHGIDDYHPTDKNIYIDSVDSKKIFYTNGIKAEERFEVIVRLSNKLSELGYKSDLNFDELSAIELQPEGKLYFVTISWG